jgi:RNA polymerase subunit RPABC4/transcription elongation factor Spt4
MIRQEMTVCQKCGALKEIGEPCDCSEEPKSEDDWWGFRVIYKLLSPQVFESLDWCLFV